MIVFCWLYGIIAVLVRVKLGSPVIFKQLRPGKDERIFCLYKFRTMTDERDESGKLLPDEQRLTKWEMAAQHQLRRAAGGVEYSQGGHERRRAKATAGGVSGTV